MKTKYVAGLGFMLLALVVGQLSRSSCPYEKEDWKVNGSSLHNLIENGDSIQIARGYYECRTVQRGDVVMINHASSRNPLIKIVHAIPGDTWDLVVKETGYAIVVNGKETKTTTGEPYRIAKERIGVLELYKHDYGETIPEDTYLVLGNIPGGTLDSTSFGLITASEISGKVLGF